MRIRGSVDIFIANSFYQIVINESQNNLHYYLLPA
mgnify:CR=1 FL=1